MYTNRVYHNVIPNFIYLYSVGNSLKEQHLSNHVEQQISGGWRQRAGIASSAKALTRKTCPVSTGPPLIVKPDLSRTYGRQRRQLRLSAASPWTPLGVEVHRRDGGGARPILPGRRSIAGRR